MDSPPTILFLCLCKHVLEAPAEWKGRQVRCTLCRSAILVPEQNDPEAVRRDQELAEGIRRAQRAATKPTSSGLALPLEADATLPTPRAPGPPPSAPKPPVPPALLGWPKRSWFLAITAVVTVPAAIVGVLWFFQQRNAPRLPSRGPAAAAVTAGARSQMQELRLAEQAYEKGNHGLAQGQRLAELYRNAAAIPGHPRSRAYVCNNAAWFFATTPHSSLRDPQRALSLARIAVDLSAGQDPNVLDTLAEALFVNRQFSEAVETEKKALSMMPDAGADFVERYQKYQKTLAPQ